MARYEFVEMNPQLLLVIDADQVLHTTENRPHKLIVDDAPLIKEALA